MRKARQRLFGSKKESQSRENSNLRGSEHTVNDPKESNRVDTTANAPLRVDLETETVKRLGVSVLHEPSRPIEAVVECELPELICPCIVNC